MCSVSFCCSVLCSCVCSCFLLFWINTIKTKSFFSPLCFIPLNKKMSALYDTSSMNNLLIQTTTRVCADKWLKCVSCWDRTMRQRQNINESNELLSTQKLLSVFAITSNVFLQTLTKVEHDTHGSTSRKTKGGDWLMKPCDGFSTPWRRLYSPE